MNGTVTAMVCIGILVLGAGGVYLVSRQMRPPVTAVVQAPSAAVAGMNALAQLASHGIDAWIANKASKSDKSEE
jgi:hypothetical protein